MRAFARDLGLAPSTVAEILGGKRNLSQDRAFLITKNLTLSETESEYFCLLAQLDTIKEEGLKVSIRARMSAIQSNFRVHHQIIMNKYEVLTFSEKDLEEVLLIADAFLCKAKRISSYTESRIDVCRVSIQCCIIR